jgi:endopeptidase Clp ATP-binding regulatory subunit ClpX
MANDKRFNPEELKQFLRSKYGSGVQVEVFPKTEPVQTEAETREASRSKALEFNYKPSQIKEYLDRYVIQQDDAKKVLATAVCDHYHHIQSCRGRDDCQDYKKQNIILIGPSGVGKTYLVQNIARLIGVPFVKADATKYSETGYVGGDVEDLIRDLVHQAGGDVELAEYGIIYLDEIDKIASPTNIIGRDVSGHGVQRGLLKLMEETEVPLRSPTDVASQMQAFIEFQAKGKIEKRTINTKHILFVVSGAFTGLLDIIKKRLGSKQIGFMGDKPSAEQEHFLFEKVKSLDFIEYGFEAELVGRLPVVVHCNPLSVQDLFNILKYSEGSLLKQYKRDFLAYGIDAYFTDDAMQAIAERAEVERTGARGLMTVCEKLFRDYKYTLPDHSVRQFVVTREMVDDPPRVLAQLLENPNLHRRMVLQFHLGRFEREFFDKYGIRISFTPEAAALAADRAESAGKDVSEFCRELFGGYEHGLNLLRKTSGKDEFAIDRETVLDPAGTLERWIRETYK